MENNLKFFFFFFEKEMLIILYCPSTIKKLYIASSGFTVNFGLCLL